MKVYDGDDDKFFADWEDRMDLGAYENSFSDRKCHDNCAGCPYADGCPECYADG